MPRLRLRPHLLLFLLISIWLTGSCRSPQVGEQITVTINADGNAAQVSVTAGSTVSQALQSAGIIPAKLDRSEPPLYTVLSNGDSITLTRVEEVFETEQVTVPFERQIVRNETLPEGETRLVQAGVNGLLEVTYRRILENQVEISKTSVKTVVLTEALPEIVMVGAQSSFTPLNIPGTLVYLAGGNAWIMEGSTANRRIIVSTGDLDGRIFKLSPNGEYLIFTRKSKKPASQEINTLWAVRTKNIEPKPIWLQAYNVVHFAEWIPGTNSVAYSTVEPRSTAPGWQANNDLYRVSLTGGSPRKMLEANSGGVYGWWGMSFAYSEDGRLAYARPDGIGLVDQDGGYLKPMLGITPLNTHSDWAWIPPITWGSDGKTLYYVTHAPAPAPIVGEESPFFDVAAISFENGASVSLIDAAGMFSYPAVSPSRWDGRQKDYQVAYLQSIFIEQSETSRYRLMVMDRDGSNSRALFPPADTNGIEPQTPSWAPEPLEGQVGDFIAVTYQGNLWLIDSGSGKAYQVTGDGLIVGIDWK
ncbi:MAG TPA: G5 domain-containing protein [Anaerolineales bacterium]|nr:G5 domain-containing protein [Anaerolineales bacterium]HMZ44424.1 G5 domain-containing protein [Anaerolineales bacterium]HNA54288.1 G5 domain-containing protein [Anaerolineales bacterium]HNC89177.1 G5 domain-containing protein [Anaerolineales bacterium]HNE68800.1 G5 domain-containing protein [Anaerolineales bacterium]